MAKPFRLVDFDGDPLEAGVITVPEHGQMAMIAVGYNLSAYVHPSQMRDLAKWLNETADEIDGEGAR